MTQPQTIPRLAAQGEPTRFDALRAEGIAWLEDLSGEVWTDYNLHDPGVTLLEALCYSLTELAYRADFPVADLLAGPRPGAVCAELDARLLDGPLGAATADNEQDHIDWAALALHLPTQVFPARASTLEDLRRLLLDRLPQLDGATLTTTAPRPDQPWAPGLYTVVLDEAPDLRQPRTAAKARRLLASQRNLGEDLGALLQVQKIACQLHGQVVIGGARDAADIVAEIFLVCAAQVGGADPPAGEGVPSATPPGQVQPLDEVLCGPLLRRGPPAQGPGDTAAARHLFIANLMASVARIDGVAEVQWLGLEPLEALEPGTPGQAWQPTVVTSSLPRRSVNGLRSLWLAPPPSDGGLRHLSVLRRGNPIQPAADEVRRRFEELRVTERTRRHGLRDLDLAYPPPRGLQPQALPHLSVQHLLPGAYGVGANGVPETATAQDKLRALQLQAYLLLFDQALANGRSQLQHLRELFTVQRAADAPTAWWAEQGPAQVPGITEVLHDPGTLAARVLQPFDNALERRHQVLDRLLALHGQTFTQNSLRQYSGHLLPAELDAYLLRNKTAFVSDLLRLGRDRGGGIDLGRPSWGRSDRASGLQRQVSLLLGFEAAHSRSLCAGLRGHRLVDDGAGTDAATVRFDETLVDAPRVTIASAPGAAPVGGRFIARPAGAQRLDLAPAQVHGVPAPAWGRRSPLGSWWLQVGACADRYSLWPGEGASAARLVLGPDEAGRCRALSLPADAAGPPEHVAMQLRQQLLAINAACEGLHVVEHLLLRRRAPSEPSPNPSPNASAEPATLDGDGAGPALTDDITADLSLSVVFPNWTARCSQPNFQRLAEESVRMACPAHLKPRCLWLPSTAMRRFEVLYRTWLRQCLRLSRAEAAVAAPASAARHAAASAARVARVDAAAAALLAHLQACAAAQARARGRPRPPEGA